jgi:hypothetical protein
MTLKKRLSWIGALAELGGDFRADPALDIGNG